MDKQSSNKTDTKIPKQSMFSKPNFYKAAQSKILNDNGFVPKFDKSSLPKTNVIVTQHKGGS